MTHNRPVHYVAVIAIIVFWQSGTGAFATHTDQRPASKRVSLYAVVTTVAPIYIGPKVQPVPLRTAAIGTRLEVLAEEGDWVQVRFGDPVLGPRVGWVQGQLIQIDRPELRPMDLSVAEPESKPTTETGGTIARATERPVAPAAASSTTRTRIPPGYKWTGIALLIWGGLTTATGFVAAEDVCYDSFSSFEEDCQAFKAGWIGAGVAITAAGAIVLGVGNGRREPVPTNSLLLGVNRIAWRVRF
jgi:hypothetical protein